MDHVAGNDKRTDIYDANRFGARSRHRAGRNHVSTCARPPMRRRLIPVSVTFLILFPVMYSSTSLSGETPALNVVMPSRLPVRFSPGSISLSAITILPEIFSGCPGWVGVGVADISLALIPIPENWMLGSSVNPSIRHEATTRPLTA